MFFGFQSANCRSLIRLKPVVKTLPSARKMARMGLAPSCAFSFSATISCLLGSMTLTFLSLDAVQMRLPLRLQLTL